MSGKRSSDARVGADLVALAALTALTAMLPASLVPAYAQANEPAPANVSALVEQLITVKRHTDHTEEVVQLAREQLALLPDAVKRTLVQYGIKIVIAPTRKEVLGTSGGACYDIKSKQVVFPEWNDLNHTFFMNQVNRRAVLLHEVGHAYDQASGRISFTPEYLQLYSLEEHSVPTGKRKLLAYFLEGGEKNETEPTTHRPPQECFASLFATKYIKEELPRLTALKNCFPKTREYVYSRLP